MKMSQPAEFPGIPQSIIDKPPPQDYELSRYLLGNEISGAVTSIIEILAVNSAYKRSLPPIAVS